MPGFDQLRVSPDALVRLYVEFGVRELAAFGSVLRDDFTDQSDVDFLVEFGPGRRVGSSSS